MGRLVKIGHVFQFPANIFFSDNIPNKGALVAGRDVKQPGPPDRANRWYRVGFKPGVDFGGPMEVLEAGGFDPGNGGTLPEWLPIMARGTEFVRKNIPALLGSKASGIDPATVDGQGDVYIDESLAASATKDGTYGSYVPESAPSQQSGVDYGSKPGTKIMTDAQRYKPAKELTITASGIWLASTFKESADDDGPHPGIGIAGKDKNGRGVYDVLAFGKPEENDLPANLYLLTITDDDVDTIRPAGQVLREVRFRASQGEESAQVALRVLGLDYQESFADSLLDDLKRVF